MGKFLSEISLKLLLIEDDDGDAFFIEEILSEEEVSFSLKRTERLDEGIKFLNSEEADLVLLDLTLPDSIGFDTFSFLQKNISSNIPVIVLTGLDDEATAIKTLAEGAQDYLIKQDIDGKLLVRSIKYAVERQKLRCKLDKALVHIEERKKIERELKEEKEKLKTILDFIQAGVVIIDRETRKIVQANPAALKIMNSSEEKVLGEVCHRYICPSSVGCCPIIDLGEKLDNSERIIITEDKRKIPVLKSVIPVVLDGHEYLLESFIDISRQKKSEEEFKTLYDFNRQIISSVNAGIVVYDKELKYKLWNPFVEKITGMAFEKVRGKPALKVFPQLKEYGADKLLKKALEGEFVSTEDMMIKIPLTGKLACVSSIYGPHYNSSGEIVGVIGVVNDITERKKVEKKNELQGKVLDGINRVFYEVFLSEHERELGTGCIEIAQELTKSSLGIIGEVNKKGLFDTIAQSDTAWEACRIPETDAVKMIRDMEIRGFWGKVIKEGKSLIVNDPLSHPESIGTPEGHPVINSFLGVPLKYGDITTGLIAVANKDGSYGDDDIYILEKLALAFMEALYHKRAQDKLKKHREDLEELVSKRTSELQKKSELLQKEIQERTNAEEKLKDYSGRLEELVLERTDELREAQGKLLRQERLSALGQFAGSVGHELKNPLGVISNAVYFLQMISGSENKKIKEYLNIILSEVKRAGKIIDDLKNFSKGRASLEKEKVEIKALISSAMERMDLPEGINLTESVPSELPSVLVDPYQISQVLFNLVKNACQAMPEGGKLSIKVFEEKGKISISIVDTGSGISPENLEKIFDPLFTTKAKGIGLGLTICKSLVEANGGEIKVMSQEGEGTAFTIILSSALS